MNFTFFLYLGGVALLLVLLFWALIGPARHARGARDETALLGQMARRHPTYLPLVRQALSPTDIAFIASRGSLKLARQVRKERRGVALSYLTALREDFTRLLGLARIVAAMSPKVATAQEAERVWLNAQFVWRYHMLRMALHTGVFPQRKLDALSHMVSELAVRMETAISELGERAAIAAKLASSLDGRGVDVT